jgi:N6-adenosine-specific RNA methylase IME4
MFDGLPREHFATIVADPPWRFATWSARGRGRSPDGPLGHYATMTLSDIKALPVADLAAPDCVLLLWAIDPMLPHALEVGAAWGFRFKTVGFYWVKSTDTSRTYPIGTGYWTRANPEQCLLFTRGKPQRKHKDVGRLIVASRGRHSEKPLEAMRRVKRLVPGPYLELFARRRLRGWSCWGNEVDTFTDRSLLPTLTAAE